MKIGFWSHDWDTRGQKHFIFGGGVSIDFGGGVALDKGGRDGRQRGCVEYQYR